MNKFMISLGIVGMLTTPVMAQQQPQSACNPECTLKVTGPELDVLSEGLQTQPFAKVVPLLQKLREQVIAQQPKPPELPKAAEPKKD